MTSQGVQDFCQRKMSSTKQTQNAKRPPLKLNKQRVYPLKKRYQKIQKEGGSTNETIQFPGLW